MRIKDFIKKPKENEIHDIVIEGIGKKGDRMGRIHNFVIFIMGCSDDIGEVVSVRITKVCEKIGFGTITNENI